MSRFHSFKERKRVVFTCSRRENESFSLVQGEKRVVFTRSRRENESFSLVQGEKMSRFHSFKERK